MHSLRKNKLSRIPSSTSLATPIYHRRRRDWRDDMYLIQEIVKNLCLNYESDNKYPSSVREFLDYCTLLEKEGYESNEKAFNLAMWIREQLTVLASTLRGYDLRIHKFEIPLEFSKIIETRNSETLKSEPSTGNSLSFEVLFPDPEVRNFAIERTQLLHKGSIISYLKYLVNRERKSLQGDSATLLDLIQTCKEELKRRKLKVISNFNPQEVDLWVPGLSLGIEIRETISLAGINNLVNLLKSTNHTKNTKFLLVISPDDLPDLIFDSWREIERSNKLPNLTILRVGDLSNYLDRLPELLQT